MKDEDAFFDGVIARDNADATYCVTFDDGDVLDAAPRHDIRLKVPPVPATKSGDSNVGERIEEEV